MFLDLWIAFIGDLVIGDPHYRWHPVRLLGRMITFYEERIRLLTTDARRGGWFLALGVSIDTWLFVFLLLFVAHQVYALLALILSAFFLYSALSVKNLADEARKVLHALEDGDLTLAREKLSMIVGRDTAQLDEQKVLRATVETVAEGTVDGIISPLFYAVLGGAPLAMAYKAINTLDSMVGHKNERYLEFGYASAKLDDWANFLPARLSRYLIALSAGLCGMKLQESLATSFAGGESHPSPNSWIPEAAFAGALGVQLGGATTYSGVTVDKPLLGKTARLLTAEDITSANRLAYMTAVITIVLFLGFLYALRFFIIFLGTPIWGGAV